MFAHISSLQLVTDLPDSNKGGTKGHVLHPKRDFRPNFSLKIHDKETRGRLVEWVEKASFVHLNKLFEIASNEKNHQTLLSA
ncbi:hypothetical protein AAG906_029656 [Vitis piasezkii]